VSRPNGNHIALVVLAVLALAVVVVVLQPGWFS
jgi:hypothetical protein